MLKQTIIDLFGVVSVKAKHGRKANGCEVFMTNSFHYWIKDAVALCRSADIYCTNEEMCEKCLTK